VNNQGSDSNNVAMDVALQHDTHAPNEFGGLHPVSMQRILYPHTALFVLDTKMNAKKEDSIKVVKTFSDQPVFEKQSTREPM